MDPKTKLRIQKNGSPDENEESESNSKAYYSTPKLTESNSKVLDFKVSAYHLIGFLL